jgi:DNA-directed RNA polymerase subunit M/transcription elongation factor TFIIS
MKLRGKTRAFFRNTLGAGLTRPYTSIAPSCRSSGDGRRRVIAEGAFSFHLGCRPFPPPLQFLLEHKEEALPMDQGLPSRTCPKCGSDDYTFRSRKKIVLPAGQDGVAVETKYRCKACGHEWKVRVPE